MKPSQIWLTLITGKHINQTYIIMKNIFRLVVILSVTEQDIQEAFKQKWKDFEDCV